MNLSSDYLEGAHETILARLNETNLLQSAGYGTDTFSESARKKIRKVCGCDRAAVHFLVGGTQTNAVTIGALLQSYQGVIAADTGHISLHEAGAIEAAGHKVLPLPHQTGKISAGQIEAMCAAFENDQNHAHMVAPGMVYLSQPTEYGTLYSLAELQAVREVCTRYDLYLYVDGARLAYALASAKNDVTMKDLARLCDAFYIGGTKCGALFGEALVIPDETLLPHFFTVMKQRGALLAKGRLLGLQFDTLFMDNLYEEIGKTALAAAAVLKEKLSGAGYRPAFDAPTNQVFVIVRNTEMQRLADAAAYSFWEAYDADHTVVRFATSWATNAEEVAALQLPEAAG